ncbi:Uncharacterized conserved protein YbbK, DUF523 family [Cetobacterium ceti]|uniref:Uncharacterized conserved protein YbbK, DUF523 family n=1 Tax=Cetobacterium ceti TaxID=180163 RepID=A0A1T4LIR1_9FUSO|nr:DUF523 domain-containing protein [Cetobacterium ceti]SJZ54600.1 Uncharacterized conserved protein YbbK, DUF523 family [Cetobacterium ceti]
MKEIILDRKIRIGISACQAGAKVRYNGKGWDVIKNIGRDKNMFIWTPVCPEIMSGMGVLRLPIKLSKGNGNDFWEDKAIIKNRQGKDISAQMKHGALVSMKTLELADIDIFIYMEGSPSCGINRTTLKNKRLGNPPGVFGSLLLKKNYFLISSQDLESPIKWWDWKRKIIAYVWTKDLLDKNLENIKEVWEGLQYLLNEIDEIKAKIIKEDILLNKDKLNIKRDILNLLREKTSLEKIKKYLWINYNILGEEENISFDDINSPDVLRGSTAVAEELKIIEKYVRKENKYFRSSPINYKPK